LGFLARDPMEVFVNETPGTKTTLSVFVNETPGTETTMSVLDFLTFLVEIQWNFSIFRLFGTRFEKYFLLLVFWGERRTQKCAKL
jgi:hypothetical protein